MVSSSREDDSPESSATAAQLIVGGESSSEASRLRRGYEAVLTFPTVRGESEFFQLNKTRIILARLPFGGS